MENLKKIFIPFTIVLAVAVLVLLMPKVKPTEKTNYPKIVTPKVDPNLTNLDFNYGDGYFAPKIEQPQSSLTEVDILNLPIWEEEIKRWVTYCQQYEDSNCQSGKKEFKTEIYPGVNLLLTTSIPEYDYRYTIDIWPLAFEYTQYLLEKDGKTFDIPLADGDFWGFSILNTNSMLVNFGCEECLPDHVYFDGSKFSNQEEIVQKCIPEEFKRMFFGQNPYFDIELQEGYLVLEENTYMLEPLYSDIFNISRINFKGGFTFGCTLPNFEFSAMPIEENSQQNKNFEYLRQYKAFLAWVSVTNLETIKKDYESWTNVALISGRSVKIPNGWSITKKQYPDSTEPFYTYTLSNNQDLNFSFSDNFLPGFYKYAISDQDHPINPEILKVLYTIKVGAEIEEQYETYYETYVD